MTFSLVITLMYFHMSKNLCCSIMNSTKCLITRHNIQNYEDGTLNFDNRYRRVVRFSCAR